MEKKRVSVFVAGQRFNILTDQDEKYVRELAAHIDARINSAVISGSLNREGAAVLTALDLADDGEQIKREIAEIREQVKDYLTRVETLIAENDQLKAELSRTRIDASALDDARAAIAAGDKEKQSLKNQIRALKEQIELMQSVGSTLPAEQEEQAPAVAEPQDRDEPPMPEEAPAQEQLSLIAEEAPADEPIPAAEEAQPAAAAEETAPAQPVVTAEDDLFFDPQEEEPVRPSRKEKKNRHDHSHVNPYKQQFMQKQEQKGYTQQRQYSLFDLDE